MPIPSPREGESENEFVSRCMSAISGEYDDNSQAVAICYSKWREHKKSAETPKLAALTSSGIASVDMRRILPRSVRAVEGKIGRVHSYAAIWGDEDNPDLYGTFFNKDTDFCMDWFDKRPWLYDHAYNNFVRSAKIGAWRDADMDDFGLFFIGELDERFRYLDELQFLMELGYLFPSSGTLSYVARIADDGWVEKWPIVELSSTVAPAEWRIPAQVDASRRRQAAQAIRRLGGLTMSEDTNVLAAFVPGVNLTPQPQEPAESVRDVSEPELPVDDTVDEAPGASANPAPGEDDVGTEEVEVPPAVDPEALSVSQLRDILQRADAELRALRDLVVGLREEVTQLREERPEPVQVARALVAEEPTWMERLFVGSRDGTPLRNAEDPGQPIPEDGGVLAQLTSVQAGREDGDDVFLTILDSQRH